MIQGSDGRLYGVAPQAEEYAHGTVYAVSPDDGAFEVLHQFKGTADGGSPTSIVEGPDGNLYGTLVAGGVNADLGGVFKLTLAAEGQNDLPTCATRASASDAAAATTGATDPTNGDAMQEADADVDGGEAGSGTAPTNNSDADAGADTEASGSTGASGTTSAGGAGTVSGTKLNDGGMEEDSADDDSADDDKEEVSGCSVGHGATRSQFGTWLAMAGALVALGRRRRDSSAGRLNQR